MKKGKGQKITKSSATEVLIPMHADNWALSLGSGYLGPDPSKDRSSDIQTGLRNHMIAFRECVPSAALSGASSVVLSASLVVPTGQEDQEVIFLNDLLRVTAVKAARFENEDERRNFIASYSLFPDIPLRLIECVIGGIERPLLEIQIPPEPIGKDLSSARKRRDYLGGLAAGLITLLETTPFEAEVSRLIGAIDSPDNVYEIAADLLKSFHPDATQEDEMIWCTTIEVLSERASERGFDREELLEEIAKRAALASETPSEALRVWVETCQKVVRSLIDPPALDDRRSIGQRAALGAILAPDFQSSSMLGTTIEVGPRVKALVTTAAYAFEGLSRVPGETKSNRELLDLICDLAEALDHGQSIELRLVPRSITSELKVIRKVLFGGRHVLTTELEPNAFERFVIEQVRSGTGVGLSPEGQAIVPRSEGLHSAFIEDYLYPDGQPGVRIGIPVGVGTNKRTVPELNAFLSRAWELAISVGLRETLKGSQYVVFGTISLLEFNSASLTRNIERLEWAERQLSTHGVSPVRPIRTRAKRKTQPSESGEVTAS
ncbi:hypothetical protein [Tunturiibacter lichenicola]|uniref:hypothetical protein n=1 Tax=Tunturiibacter lichenicola TaxID=2051959 RepID=UPI003D9B7789